MKKYSVTILPEKITVEVLEGTRLIIAAKEAGIDISGNCGSRGTCGKCLVKIVSEENSIDQNSIDQNSIEGTSSEKFSIKETNSHGHLPKKLADEGYILSCEKKVTANIVIEIPRFSRLTEHKIELSGIGHKTLCESVYLQDNEKNPICRKYYLELAEPGLSDSINDLDRLRQALSKDYNVYDVVIGLKMLRELPIVLRDGKWKITATVVSARGKNFLVKIEAGRSTKPAYGMACDIGTTTIAINLVNLETGKIVGCDGNYNKQSVYGSDVISRIVFTEDNNDGLEILQKAVVDSINEICENLCKQNGILPEDISVMVCAGNTVMSHLLMKIPANFIRREPYIPAVTKFPEVLAEELGININNEGLILLLPLVASYVGGDITSGVLAIMQNRSDKLTLFMDVGTNGELVLGNSDWMVTCSCSAGPAFEGSGISCGMRAMEGAIDWLSIDENLRAKVRVIGDVKPLGICGSGLIYAVSQLMRARIIDRSGKIHENLDSDRISRDENGIFYIVVSHDESGTDRDVIITENDIKNLLRAKAAVFAGIQTMLSELSLTISDIEKIFIAGGFGNYINIIDAINIGLLPDLDDEIYEYVGNSSVQGAVITLLSQEALNEVDTIASQMTNLELSIGNKFMDEFISALFIPHTNLDLFPNVKNIVEV